MVTSNERPVGVTGCGPRGSQGHRAWAHAWARRHTSPWFPVGVALCTRPSGTSVSLRLLGACHG